MVNYTASAPFSQVTPFAGVWIEIPKCPPVTDTMTRHSLCGSVDWNNIDTMSPLTNKCHSLCGSVDWNLSLIPSYARILSHSLFGSVDWNTWNIPKKNRWPTVTPFAGVWIEIEIVEGGDLMLQVTPFAGVWIEIYIFVLFCGAVYVTPFAGVWIEIEKEIEIPIFVSGSLPLRECGLKSARQPICANLHSHSLCGSVDWNFVNVIEVITLVASLPLRECGLKYQLWTHCITWR